MRLHIDGKRINLKGYSNVDWVGSVKNYRSTSENVSFDGEGAVSWCCKWQQTMAQSTMG